jgi:mannosyl-oligosaccharide alpha-1,2-mannosidase
VQHLGCFAGGMVAIGSKIFNKKQDMATAWKMVEGCLWGYENSPNGIMPEIMSLIPCHDRVKQIVVGTLCCREELIFWLSPTQSGP